MNTNVVYKPGKPHYNVTPNSSSNTQFNSLLKAEKNGQKTNSGKQPKYITNSVESQKSIKTSPIPEDKDAQIRQQAQLILILKSITQADLAFENLNSNVRPSVHTNRVEVDAD